MSDDRYLTVGFSRATWHKFLGVPTPPFLSWFIMWVIRRPYSHAFWMWDVTRDDGSTFQCVYEASGTNVKFLGPEAIRARMILVKGYRIKVGKDQFKTFMRECMYHSCDAYGLVPALGVALVKLVYWFTGRSIRNPWADGNSTWFCNELGEYLFDRVMKLDLQLAPIEREQAGPELLDRVLNELVERGILSAEVIDFTKAG